MTEHDLKIWPEFFDSIQSGEKTFDLRQEDNRHFDVGDILLLRELAPQWSQYTGRKIRLRVTYLLRHNQNAGCAATFGLRPNYVIMGLANEQTPRPTEEK